jgi:hypothetical protein
MPTAPVLPRVDGEGAGSASGFLGVLMLDTQFPRFPGDIGHPRSWRVATRHAVVPGAWPREVVTSAAALRAGGLLKTFCRHAVELEQAGARAITTSCGFLVLLQAPLQAAVRIPVVTSSLLQLPRILLTEAKVGVLTISAEHLGADHLRAAGVPEERLNDVIVQGVAAGGEFVQSILGNRPAMDFGHAEADVVAAARALRARAPELRVVVLECTNMPPYAAAIAHATGFELRSLLDADALVQWARP